MVVARITERRFRRNDRFIIPLYGTDESRRAIIFREFINDVQFMRLKHDDSRLVSKYQTRDTLSEYQFRYRVMF